MREDLRFPTPAMHCMLFHSCHHITRSVFSKTTTSSNQPLTEQAALSSSLPSGVLHRPCIAGFPSHVFVDRRPRDPKLPRKQGLSLAGFNSASQIIGLGCGQAPDSAEVDIPLLRQRDSLALALSDQVTLELSHGTDYAQ